MSTHTGATTNYSIQKPSYEYTDRTTQFDDALLQRGIVTTEQVLLAKGMPIETAEELMRQQQQRHDEEVGSKTRHIDVTYTIAKNNEIIDKVRDNDAAYDDDSDSEFEGDDKFLQEYNQRRLMELRESLGQRRQGSRIRKFGDVIIIDRTEWQHHINDDSKDVWVVVGLLSAYDSERTGMMEKAMRELASLYVDTKFVLISSHQAIANWPEENLPSLFLYREGKMQHELIRLSIQITTKQLEKILDDLNVL